MAIPNSRATLIEYCLRRLGDPVIEINVDPDQLEDRLDEALQHYQEFHSDATLKTFIKHQITADDVINEWIPIPSSVTHVTHLFPISAAGATRGMFSIKYQMAMNDMAAMGSFIGDLAYFYQMQQYLGLIDAELTGTPTVQFSRMQEKLYIRGDLRDGDLKEGDWVIAEVYQIIDAESTTKVYNDKWLKEYTTALIKQQWGANLIKFEGMQLPGGVTLNGRQIFDDGTADMERLRESIRLEYELPTDFYVG
jgi:hypothetical protein